MVLFRLLMLMTMIRVLVYDLDDRSHIDLNALYVDILEWHPVYISC